MFMFTSSANHKVAALLAVVVGNVGPRTDAIGLGATAGHAIGVAKALARDELGGISLAYVLKAGAAAVDNSGPTWCRHWRGDGGADNRTVAAESATRLVGLELGAGAGADADLEERRALGLSVGFGEALATDELDTLVVADVLCAFGIG